MSKIKKQPRDDNGKFIPKDKGNDNKEKTTEGVVERKAIFASIGQGTCNKKRLVLNYKPSIEFSDKGERIKFQNGKYETSDLSEIEFLKWKEKHPIAFSAIKCIQEPKNIN